MINNCPKCSGMGWIGVDDPRGAAVGYAYRCCCNPETPESVMHGYNVSRKVDRRPDHPEVALGIPLVIVTAKPAFKETMAKRCQYEGPKTIAEFVEQGKVARENAIGMVKYWLQEGGDLPTADKLLETL